MRQKIVAGNWKMNGPLDKVIHLSQELNASIDVHDNVKVIVFPPSIYLPLVYDVIKSGPIALGAQNIYPKEYGAFTGEVSASMVKACHGEYILVGHSERRQLFHEDENFIAQKFHHVKEHGMIPVLCVGETLNQREKGQTEQVIAKQLQTVCENNKESFKNCIVAYEPVWAIGTGMTATPEQAQEVHRFIRSLITEMNESGAQDLPIIYGGSVNEKNAKALFSMPDIDGGLVGGASLNAQQFLEIVKCIN